VALLFALAFPNTSKANIAGFAWIAPSLLVFAAHGKDRLKSFGIGLLVGFISWLTTLYWLLLIPYRWHGIPFLPALGWISLCAYLALFPATWLWLVSNWKNDSWLARLIWSIGGGAIWVGLEMARGRLFGGFPWNFLGASQAQMTPLIQIASVTGVYGISFLVVWTSLSLYSSVRMVIEKPKVKFVWQLEIAMPLFAIAGIFALGEFQLLSQKPSTSNSSTLRVTLIQPSVPQNLIWDPNANSNRFQELLTLSETALTNQSDLLVWPESAVPELNDDAYRAITNLVIRHHVWLIFNADDFAPRANMRNDYDIFNAAFLMSPDGKFAGAYHKQALVIFGEYIPLEHSLPFIKFFTPITGSFAAGNEPVQFRWGVTLSSPNQIKTSPLICYEDMFPRLGRAATTNDTDFLVNLTNDGWFGDSAEQWQHETGAIFRAVENGIPLVRCCNNGVTCWIDEHGRVREIFRDTHGSVYGAGALTIDLPLQSHAQTFYNRHGDWFGWSCVAITGILFAAKIRRRRQ